jgi:2-(1,2-epoxy-1,2-dihydrophenyl)acetyl-CoA isomerase
MRRYMDSLMLRLNGFRFPIVTAINGIAAGAGMSLALAGDIIVCGEDGPFPSLLCAPRIGTGCRYHLQSAEADRRRPIAIRLDAR